MKLSDRQVHIVNAFLRDAALDTPSEPPSARVHVLTHLRRQLRAELARKNDSTLRDDELIRVLNRIQFPDRAAIADAEWERRSKTHVPRPEHKRESNGVGGENGHGTTTALLDIDRPKDSSGANIERIVESAGSRRDHRGSHLLPSGPLASSQRIWLGACIALADRLDVPVDRVRAAAIAIGILTGPFAVAMYLAMYTFFYMGEHGKGAPRIDPMRVVRGVAGATAAIVAMALFFSLAVLIVDFVHRLAIGYPPDLDEWSSFARGVNRMLIMAAAVVLPFAALRGLPVAPPWDLHLPRLIRGSFAALASLLALALASYLTGALISGVRDWPA